MLTPMISMPNGAEWFVILAIVILVFGAAKLPDLARSSGQALRIFKAETKGLRDDKKDETVAGELAEGSASPESAPAEAAEQPDTPQG